MKYNFDEWYNDNLDLFDIATPYTVEDIARAAWIASEEKIKEDHKEFQSDLKQLQVTLEEVRQFYVLVQDWSKTGDHTSPFWDGVKKIRQYFNDEISKPEWPGIVLFTEGQTKIPGFDMGEE